MSRGSPVLLLFLICGMFVFPMLAQAQFTVETQHTELDPGAKPPPRAGQPKNKVEGDNPVEPEDVNVDPFWLGTIKHRSLKVRDVESDAFYKVLDHARKARYDLQRRVAAENVARHEKQFHEQPATKRMKFSLFADVFTHPEEYTGELLTFRGYVRKNTKNPVDPDDPTDFPTYEAWLYTPDSQHNPVVVVYTEIPKGMPLGGNLVETVEVTGYFFKVYGYRAQDGLRAAPMLIAKKLEWTPRVEKDKTQERIIYFLITGSLVLGIIFVFWQVNRHQHQRLATLALEPEGFDPRDLQSLKLDVPVDGTPND